jgi:hypothetical protein
MPVDAAVSRALARKEALLRDIERSQTELRDIETFLALYARFAGTGTNTADVDERVGETRTNSEPPPPDDAEAGDTNAPGAAGNVSQAQFEVDARTLLIENGRPMQRGQFIKSFHAHGLRVGGSDEAKNFGTKIWKARAKFINISSEGYWPRDIDCPAVGYRAENTATETEWSDNPHSP